MCSAVPSPWASGLSQERPRGCRPTSPATSRIDRRLVDLLSGARAPQYGTRHESSPSPPAQILAVPRPRFRLTPGRCRSNTGRPGGLSRPRWMTLSLRPHRPWPRRRRPPATPQDIEREALRMRPDPRKLENSSFRRSMTQSNPLFRAEHFPKPGYSVRPSAGQLLLHGLLRSGHRRADRRLDQILQKLHVAVAEGAISGRPACPPVDRCRNGTAPVAVKRMAASSVCISPIRLESPWPA
jgi:hypothetical protein